MDNFDDIKKDEVDLLKKIRSPSDKSDYYPGFFGLAFSGGGIRSATFNLGILQALAKAELLRKVDYLSTVSGGGYIGSWLTALIYWHHKSNPTLSHHRVLLDVESELAQRPQTEDHTSLAEEPQSIRFLREYSNYLTPKAGLFSTDTLSSVANYLRNLYLNQLTLLSLLIAILLIPRLIFALFAAITQNQSTLVDGHGLWILGFLSLAIVIFISAKELDKDVKNQIDAHQVGKWVLTPIFLAAVALSYQLNTVAKLETVSNALQLKNDDSLILALTCVLTGSLLYGVTYFLIMLVSIVKDCWGARNAVDFNFQIVAPFVAGAMGGFLCFLLTRLFLAVSEVPEHRTWFAIAIGTLLMLKIFSLVVVLHIGLVSRGFSEENREWWGRLGGMMISLGVIWLALFAIAIYGPILWVWTENWILYIGGSGWIMSTIAGILLGGSDKSGHKNANPLLEKVLSLTPYIFIVGLLLVLSYGIDRLDGGITSPQKLLAPQQVTLTGEIKTQIPLKSEIQIGSDQNQPFSTTQQVLAEFKAGVPMVSNAKLHLPATLSFKTLADKGLKDMAEAEGATILIAFAVCIVLFALLSWRVDINLFSMHHYYHNRLIRCYLGASRARHPSPFTGFDPVDDIPLAGCKHRPYHLINTAINLVSGDNLAWQQRKAGSFVFTPQSCGFEFNSAESKKAVIGGFRATKDYMSDPHQKEHVQQGAKLGTAFAISGAAASPNMGYHTSPGLAFLMTMFNVRLGRWCGNPARKPEKLSMLMALWTWLTSWAREEKPGEEWKAMGPSFSGKYLLSELLGMSDEKSPFVYLSDGGHFENLGLYELVRRQCKLIVVCDVGADPEMGFEDLGNAIRKCKIDFGAEIDVDIKNLKRKTDSRFSENHWHKGSITYRDGTTATLFYIKSSLIEDDPAEIQQYALQEPSFPHQTTADQWFDEAQFESYRKLGEVIGEEISGEIRKVIT